MNDLLQVWQFAIPVALAALGETISQRAGVITIGLEGSMLSAAYIGALAGLRTGNPWIGMTAGLIAGIIIALLSAFFIVKLAADQVVVGAAVNLMALGVTGTLFRAAFGQSGTLLSFNTLPKVNGIDALMIATVVLVPLVHLALKRTGWGLVTRAAGEFPKAVEAEGYRVDRLRVFAMILAGAFSGLAGGYLSLGIVGSFAENMTAGRGFLAIALVTFGRWNPYGVFAAAMMMGYLELLQFKFQAEGAAVPYQLLLALPYLVALVVLIIAGKGTKSPAALGVPFRRER